MHAILDENARRFMRWLLVWVVSALAAGHAGADESRYVRAVRTFADNVLTHGRDTYGEVHSPLFVDGINIHTHEPAVWVLPEERAEHWQMPRTWIMSNLASQQNLFRTFVALTTLTGEPKYKEAAVEATRYALENCRHESGLFFWGGHTLWDLASHQPVGEGRTGGMAGKHEFKSHLPFYEFLWELDPDATKRFIESLWTNHVLCWDNLDMNRHGTYAPPDPNVWDHDYTGGPLPFTGRGLTFMASGSDLFYAGAMLSTFTGDRRPLTWAKRMAARYADVCHPTTGLGADNYSLHESHRMIKQFPQFGGRFSEATITSIYNMRYSRVAIAQLKLAERLGDDGEEFKRWAVADLTAFARHAYDWSTRSFWPTLIDGTRLRPEDRLHEGYVNTRWLSHREPNPLHFWAYALAYKHTGDPFFWKMTREVGQVLDLTDIGEKVGGGPARTQTHVADPDLIFGLLELQEATGDRAYLELARSVGDNILEACFCKGFFVPSAKHVYAKFDDTAPLALLYLEAAGRDAPPELPMYAANRSYFHGPYDGEGRTYDRNVLYAKTVD